ASAPPHATTPPPAAAPPHAAAPPAAAPPEPHPHAAPPYSPEPPRTHDGVPHAPAREDSLAATAQAAWDGARPAYDGEPAHAGSVTALPDRDAGADPRHGPAAGMDDSDLWIATLERHIDRCQREGGGLALLRVELVDGDRVAASAPDGQAHVPYGRLAQAIRRAIRRQDLVASDHQGRAWVIAPGVGRAGAIALAERIGAGVENGESWRGAPLAATIGFAVYGEDGRDAATLIDRAEEAMLAATAAGARIGEAAPHPEDLGGDPDRPGPRLVR
ncbi:diguanylate cyclase, partial [Conexibacter sp. CPCC 205706]